MVSNIAEKVEPFGEWKNLKSMGASRLLSRMKKMEKELVNEDIILVVDRIMLNY